MVSAFHDAWRKGLVTPAKFEGVLRRLGAPGRAGTVAARALLAEAMGARRPARSGYELVLADAIVGAGLPRPELNHPVRRPNGRMAEIDLAWPAVLYGDEFDHSFTHASPAEWRADIVRSVDLGTEGWWIDRFCEVHVEQHLDDVVGFIGTRLEERLRGRTAA